MEFCFILSVGTLTMTNIIICIVDEELYSSSLNKIVCLSAKKSF